jgi:hypothetical protein
MKDVVSNTLHTYFNVKKNSILVTLIGTFKVVSTGVIFLSAIATTWIFLFSKYDFLTVPRYNDLLSCWKTMIG